jgi:hypothetical protein
MEIPEGLKSRHEAGTPTWHLSEEWVRHVYLVYNDWRPFPNEGSYHEGHQGIVLAWSLLAIVGRQVPLP